MKAGISSILFIVFFWGLPIGADPIPASSFLKNRPRLVVVVSVDQFRADYLTRYADKFLPAISKNTPGGFRWLMEKGSYFPQGEFAMLQNMTGPGHAVLLSGAYPYRMGIPLNDWFNVEAGKKVYCAGGSPENLIGTTVGDELKNVSPESRVISLALKDRSAILMGGHRADLALWMDPETFQWISSPYYVEQGKVPDWVQSVNETLKKAKEEPVTPSNHLSFFGLKFPARTLASANYRWGDKAAAASPAGAVVTEFTAEKALAHYQLGKGKATDLLAISFSSHDYVGHAHGPNSAEIEAQTISEDVILSKLFSSLEKHLPNGLKDAVVVLSADHGIPSRPEWAKAHKIPSGRIDSEKLVELIETELEQKLGSAKGGWLHKKVIDLNFYLNRSALASQNASLEGVSELIKSILVKQEGIAHAFSATDVRLQRLPPGILKEQISHSYFPGRSGDVVAISKPYYFAGDAPADHQTGYAYDRTVPIVLAGRSFRPGVYATKAETIDIAPTLAFILGIIPPSQSEGRVLSETLTP